MELSVIIPNYNGALLLPKCIQHVLNAIQNTQIKTFEIIVSDDASTDNSKTVCLNLKTKVQFLDYATNTGFSGNVNRGINASQYHWILILNTDIFLDDSYLLECQEAIKIHGTACYTGAVYNLNYSILCDAAKAPKHKFGKITTTLNLFSKAHAHLPSFFCSGSNLLIHKEIINTCGALHEGFNPYYYEDAEWGIRIGRMGYKQWYISKAKCAHLGSATIKTLMPIDVAVTIQRNRIILHYLHLKPFAFVFYALRNISAAILQFVMGKKVLVLSIMAFIKIRKTLHVNTSRPYMYSLKAYVNQIQKQLPSSDIMYF
jgi:GT2 family glycosyltransferase